MKSSKWNAVYVNVIRSSRSTMVCEVGKGAGRTDALMGAGAKVPALAESLIAVTRLIRWSLGPSASYMAGRRSHHKRSGENDLT